MYIYIRDFKVHSRINPTELFINLKTVFPSIGISLRLTRMSYIYDEDSYIGETVFHSEGAILPDIRITNH